jgi:hypothetical protein
MDDDCDTVVDDGFNLMSDPRHCGGCGRACNRTNSQGTCSQGTCSFACLPGFHDLDGNEPNGCEYLCIPTNGGVEACDGFDNDCDGETDEGFNLDTDPMNCGGCNRVCVALNATATCVARQCDYDREIGCTPPFTDIGDDILGCEYECAVAEPGPELCDNIDNDCDGVIDEGAPGGGDPCGSDIGECSMGTTMCVAGAIRCVQTADQLPKPETCDGNDNDCDGESDEGFNKTSDPRHCGPACTRCEFANAIAKCVSGASGLGECAIAVCLPGFVDRDGMSSTGCEYACVFTGSEVCDGRDNDCNGMVDDGLVPPSGICADKGACAGTVAACGVGPQGCDQTVRWRCPYGSGAELDPCGNLIVQETRCDDVDGDCDGVPDDAFPQKGQFCGGTQPGVCPGEFECNTAGTGVVCTPARTPAPDDTTCDGVDDDCDGALDENAVGLSVVVGNVSVDLYEASRPDATGTSAGSMDHRPCSLPGRLPWTNVSQTDAAALCLAAGKRLCTEVEWQAACQGGMDRAYPYGDEYEELACNGADRPEDDLLATGSLSSCAVSASGPFDMSGNAKEWTSTVVGDDPVVYRIRGGAYDSVAPGLTCEFAFVAAEADFAFGNLGFRCCK